MSKAPLHGSSAFTAEQVKTIRALYDSGMRQYQLADQYGVAKRTIGRVVRGERYQDTEVAIIVRCPACDRYTRHTAVEKTTNRYECGQCKRVRLISAREVKQGVHTMTTQPLTSVGQNGKIALQHERRRMDEQELVSLLKEHGGWSLRRRMRGGRPYLYAQRREDAGMKERYITPSSRLERLTPEKVINKLEGNRPKSAAALEFLTPGQIVHSRA